MRYAVDAKGLILDAAACARELGHSYVGSAHLLLALLRGPGDSGQLLRGMGLETAHKTGTVCVLLFNRVHANRPLVPMSSKPSPLSP